MVKYADGPTATVEVEIEAPHEAVWELVSDINAPAQFSTEFQGADWIDDVPAVGATFQGRNQHDVVGEWSVVCTVTEYDAEPRSDGSQVFEWVTGKPEFTAARWRLELSPDGAGSRLRFTSTIGPAPSGLTPAIERMPDREEDIVARRMSEHAANMLATIEGYKQLAESAANGG